MVGTRTLLRVVHLHDYWCWDFDLQPQRPTACWPTPILAIWSKGDLFSILPQHLEIVFVKVHDWCRDWDPTP